jgi:outer membrane protein assembly factor BamB
MAMAIELGGSGNLTDTAAVRWKLNRGTPYASSPLLYDGLLYFFQHVTPILTCVDAATGQPHYAQQRLEGLTNVYASPIGASNRVYVTGLDGTTHVLEKSKELKILATNKLDDSFAASPAVVANELFLRGRSHLYCIAEK